MRTKETHKVLSMRLLFLSREDCLSSRFLFFNNFLANCHYLYTRKQSEQEERRNNGKHGIQLFGMQRAGRKT